MSARTVYDHPVFVPHEIVPAKPMAAGCGPAPSSNAFILPSLGEVLFMPLNQMRRLDVGFVNLLCATSLPDTGGLDISTCLKTLSAWTQRVSRETERCMRQFHRSPGDYNNSEAYYRALMMVTVLQQDCGVRYNADAINTKRSKPHARASSTAC